MHKEKPSTFLGRCTKLAHGNRNNKRCHQYQEKSQPTDCSTKHTTRNSHPHSLSFKHHQICHSGEQAMHQHSNGHSRIDHQDVVTLYNFTSSLYNSLSYQQVILHIWSILGNRPDSLYYMREVAMHTVDYRYAATTGILSSHVLPVKDLREMLLHIEEALPLTIHLPVSSEDTVHFYRYLCTHILSAYEQFLLLINVPIWDHAQHLEIYEVFNLVIPCGNFSACYNINSRYLGIKYDETKAVEIMEDEFSTCQKANRQFCSLNTPLQPLANPTTCIAALYAKNKARIEKRCSLQIRKVNSVGIPTPIASNIWILTLAPTAVSKGIMLICPKERLLFIKTQTLIHITLIATSL